MCFLPCTVHASEATFALVKNKQNPIDNLTPTEVRNIFTGKTGAFATGAVQLVFCKSNLGGPSWLAEKVLDVPMETMFAKIRQEVFRERMSKPLLVASDAMVMDAVKNNAAAIGVVAKKVDMEIPREVAFVPIVGIDSP